MEMNSIGKEAAIALAKSKWWENKTAEEIVRFQLFTQELSMPFSIFHQAIEKVLKRSVFTHELGLNFEGLCKEFLGEVAAPSFQEIIDMIPEEKRILVVK